MTERELARGAGYRMAILRHAEEVSGNVAKTCSYYDIAPQTFYRWAKRYRQRVSTIAPIVPLESEGDQHRGRRQGHPPSPNDYFGPRRFDDLKGYHDIELSPFGVGRILKRLDMTIC